VRFEDGVTGNAVILSAGSGGQSTARLVAGTSVVAMFLLSSIACHAIPGECARAGKYTLFLTVIKGSCGQVVYSFGFW